MKKLSTIVLNLMLCLSPALGGSSVAGSDAPYPASKAVTRLAWDSDVLIMEGCISGDNWPIAWVNDNLQITAFCDGKTMWLLYSGLDCGLYSFCLKKATLFTF